MRAIYSHVLIYDFAEGGAVSRSEDLRGDRGLRKMSSTVGDGSGGGTVYLLY
jgi:hypothetical protein